MQQWHWIVAAGVAYLGVAVALAHIDWHGLSGRAGVPIHAQSFRERWAVYGMPIRTILLYPALLAVAALLATAEGATRLLRRRSFDLESARAGRTPMSLSEAMHGGAMASAPEPQRKPTATSTTAAASTGSLATGRQPSLTPSR